MEKRRPAILFVGILLAFSPFVFALDPSLDVNQYAHTVWRVSQGFSKGAIRPIAQTADGYLWLGTELGLLRFDGVRAIPWQPPSGEHLPSSNIRSLRVARDGSLWIGTYSGLVNWKDGKLIHYPKFDGLVVESVLEDHEGTFWVVAGWTLSEARLCRIKSGETLCYGENGGPGYGITCIYEDTSGTLWAGAMEGIWRWKPGPPKLYRMAGLAQRTYSLSEGDDGSIFIARRGGITKLRNGKFEDLPIPARLQFQPGKLLRDREGSVWVGALVDQGLLHIHQGKMDVFTPADGVSGDLSGDSVRDIFEDREGNIWVSTPDGLDRFRDFAVPTFSVQQGLSSRGVASILAAHDGSIWIGTSVGLTKWMNGKVTVYLRRGVSIGSPAGGLTAAQLAEPEVKIREISATALPQGEVQSLFEDDQGTVWISTAGGLASLKNENVLRVESVPPGNVPSITGDHAGNLWMSHDEGLFHLYRGVVADRIPWASLGHKEPATALLHDAEQDGLWVAFREGGAAFLKGGQIRASYTDAQGFAGGAVHSFYRDNTGILWAAAEGGLSRIKDGNVLTLRSQNGLPCDNVQWMMDDDLHSVWLYTGCGLMRIARSDLDDWVSDPKRKVQATVFDASDGVKSHVIVSGYTPIVAKAPDGRLWICTTEGVRIVDPRHLASNKQPPPVHIEQVTADDKPYDAKNGMRLPPRNHYLSIDYTALSLVAPEKVRFRYKLEGLDPEWREAVNDREVQYSNLGPGTYRFRVKACNNSGMWNEEGATLDFVIPPMWYQTNWFYALCAAAFLAMVWAIYELRVQQLAQQFNMRLEERVSERTRIARDLHDTLLQSFQALLPLFQVGIKKLPGGAVESRKTLELALDRASEAIGEGRDAIKGLRMSTIEKNDLATAIRIIGEDLAAGENGANSLSFRLLVEGTARELHPILRDEIYRLATEALRNAFQHAQANNLEVEIRYDEKYFRLRVRDDGKGIPSDALSAEGREGHYGLPGMRERAKLVGGKLTIWTELDSGTEIELVIPGAKAYVKSIRPFWYFGKRSGTETNEKETIEHE